MDDKNLLITRYKMSITQNVHPSSMSAYPIETHRRLGLIPADIRQETEYTQSITGLTEMNIFIFGQFRNTTEPNNGNPCRKADQ